MPVNSLDVLREKQKGRLLKSCRLLIAAGFCFLSAPKVRKKPIGDSGQTKIQSGVAYVGFGVENPSLFRLMFGSELWTIKQDSESALALASASAKGVLEQIIRRGVLAGVFVPSLRRPKGKQVLVLAAWSMVHGLTTLAIDGAVAGTGPVINDYAEKVARTFCRGIVCK